MRNFRFLLTSTLLLGTAAAFFFGCNQANNIAAPCESGFGVQFALTSVKDSLPLDSLSIKITVGDKGTPQSLTVNLKTGVSTASITAAQGDAYSLGFELYSSGKKIGSGTQTGTLNCALAVNLNPTWDTVITQQVKKDLAAGQLLPTRLSQNLTQTLAGKNFNLPLDALPGVNYRWYAKLGENTFSTDESTTVQFMIPDSLEGKSFTLRLQAVKGTKIVEERIWMISVIKVIPVVSSDRLVHIRIQADSTAKDGNSQAFKYTGPRLTQIETYESINPPSTVVPMAVESLFYDAANRVIRTTSVLTDKSKVDSLFTYDSKNNLLTLTTINKGIKSTDSLTYSNNKLATIKKCLDGLPQCGQLTTLTWTSPITRIDSVFKPLVGGNVLQRVTQNLFQDEKVIQRKISKVVGGSLQLDVKEILAYSIWGGLAYHEYYQEGFTPKLETTENYSYNSKGQLVVFYIKDEVQELLTRYIRYEYAPAGAAKNSAIAYAPLQLNNTSISSVLAEIEFSHTVFDRISKSHSLTTGN